MEVTDTKGEILTLPQCKEHNHCKTFYEYAVLQFSKYFQKRDHVCSFEFQNILVRLGVEYFHFTNEKTANREINNFS